MTAVTRLFCCIAAALTLSAPLAARAQAAQAGDAAPAADLSAICTDRPTKSSAACTVEPGHLQYESDLFNGAFLRLNGVTTDTYLVTNPTLKYGLARGLDVEANISPYEVVRTHDIHGGGGTLGGVGDLYLRLKYNFYNSADGRLTIAAIPYVKAPTARIGIGNGAVEGGSVLAVNYKLTDKLTFTTAPEVDDFKDSTGSGRHVNTIQLVNLGYSLPCNLTVYGELWGDWNFDPADTIRQYSADAAVAWGISQNLQLDAGLNFGLNRYTPGVQGYVGISQKF